MNFPYEKTTMHATIGPRYLRGLLRASAVLQLLFAADIMQAQTYTLQQCIDIGLRQSTDLLRARNEIETAESYKTQAFGAFLPSLSASGSWSRYDKDQIGLRGSGLFTSRNSYSYSVRSGLLLFDGLANIRNAERGMLGVQAAEHGRERREQDVVYAIQSRFYNALRTRQLVTVNTANLDRSRRQLERIREFNAAGAVPQADVYRQEVQVGRDELALLQAQNDEATALLDLQTQLALRPSDSFEIDARGVPARVDSTEIVAYRATLPPLQELVQQAIARRADVRQSDLTIEGAGKGVGSAFAGHLPSVTAFLQHGWNNLELTQFDEYSRTVYGVSIELPIFSNFQVSSNVQRARIDRLNAEYARTDLERSIVAELRKALNTLTTAEKNVEIARRIVVSAQEDHRIASERYSLGAGTLLDQIIAASNLTAAESDVVNATFNYLIARHQLDHQLGLMNY